MDNIWRRIMERVHAQPLMSEVADTPGLLEELQKCNRSLDIVEKVGADTVASCDIAGYHRGGWRLHCAAVVSNAQGC